MSGVLLLGATGFIGRALLQSFIDGRGPYYRLQTVSMRNPAWLSTDLSGIDCIVNAAGVAHRRAPAAEMDLVNRQYPVQMAQRARNAGVGQFVQISSMSVYGMSEGEVALATPPNPQSNYAESKLGADEALLGLANPEFKVAIVRPPMVYGPDAPGNYGSLSRIARHAPFFPDIKNRRSMIYVSNLVDHIRTIATKGSTGISHPQNAEYVCTSSMVHEIATAHDRRNILKSSANPLVAALPKEIKNKVFGDLYYLREVDMPEPQVSFRKSIRLSENLL